MCNVAYLIQNSMGYVVEYGNELHVLNSTTFTSAEREAKEYLNKHYGRGIILIIEQNIDNN